jgi:DNA recombination protein RmuC
MKSLVKENKETEDDIKDIETGISGIASEISGINSSMEADRKNNAYYNSALREDVQKNFRALMEQNSGQKDNMLRVLTESINSLQESNEHRIKKIEETVDKKLEMINGAVSEKLDKTLNERIDISFKQVGEQLSNLYRSLGELKNLSSGVQDLNKTLTNVKTRGVWGEMQLERILEQTFTPSQYEVNIPTKKNSTDRVEFAIKVPGEGGETVYLPIDAKFPADIYNKIVDASESSDTDALSGAIKELKARVLTDARKIRDKYIDPPNTTTFGILFLPTEGLYAEVLRIDGLAEQCRNMNVLITGPTTITAVLNSLQAGFRNIQLSKKSVEVMNLLEAVKAQFTKMNDEISRTQKKLHEASDATDKLKHRTDIIQKRMKNIGELELEKSEELLEIESEEE